MWLLSQIHLIAFISYLYLSLYVLIQNPKHRLNRSCAVFIACLSVWSLEKIFYSAPGMTSEGAWLWNNIGSLGWIGVSPVFLWFSQALTGRTETPRARRLLWIVFAIGVVLMVIQYKRLIISEFILMPYGWKWRWSANFWMWTFFAYYLALMLYGLITLYFYARRLPAIALKVRVIGIVIYTSISLGLASITDTIAPLLGIHAIPPIGNILCLVWAVWLGYTIARHRFLTISPTTAAENIIGTMSDLLVLTDTNWRIVRVNRAVEECLGWQQKRLEGRLIYDVFMPDDQCKQLENYFSQGQHQIKNHRLELKTRSGRSISAILSSSPLMNNDQLAGIVTLIKDISGLQSAEAALRISEERYRELVESINEVVFSQDANGVITYLSPAFESLTGYNISESLGRYTVDLVHPDDIDELYKQKASLYEGRVTVSRYRLHRKDGCFCWVQASGRPVIVDGKVVGANGILTDITEQISARAEKKILEARLAKAEKMEAIGTLAGAVAHDLNNVLSGIVSYPELLLLELPEDSHLRQKVHTIKTSGEKAAAIVQDLLTLARRGVIKTELVDLNQIVKEYLNSPECLQLKAHSPDIQVDLDLADDLHCIAGSPIHLSKTIMNLIANAFDAISDGHGHIALKTENSTIAISSTDALGSIKKVECVRLKIKDTGMGISPEDQEHIFEPFFTRKVMGRSGTGLGMSVVWGAVQDHNGHIDISSTLGEGTEFTLNFPKAEGEKNVVNTDSNNHAAYLGQGESILVVDDVADQRKIATDILSRMGYKVHSVYSGERAIEYLADHSVDLVLLDMMMDPGMDGLDTFKEICRISPGQKVLIASGYSENDRIREAFNCGVVDCLKKPYLMGELGSKVRAALRL